MDFRVARYLVIIVLAIIIFSTLAPKGLLHLPEFFLPVNHALAYGALSFLVVLAWRDRRFVFLSISFLILLGLGLELAQLLIPGRTASAVDFFVGLVGLAFGTVAGLCTGTLLRRFRLPKDN